MVPYQKGSFCEISLGHILIISLIILVVLSSSHFTKQSPWSAVQLLAKRLLHRFYTHRFSFSPFLLLLRNIHNGPHKATGSLFSVFSSLTHCFHSQMETKRTAILLFCFLLSFFLCVFLCFVVGSVSLFLSYVFFFFFDGFLSYVDFCASAVFLIDWFHQGTNYVYEFS